VGVTEDDKIGAVIAHMVFDSRQGLSPHDGFMDDENPRSSGLKKAQGRESARRQMRVHVSGHRRHGRDGLQLDGHGLRPQIPGVQNVVDPVEDIEHPGIQEPMGVR
jgi:hypothetical protein